MATKETIAKEVAPKMTFTFKDGSTVEVRQEGNSLVIQGRAFFSAEMFPVLRVTPLSCSQVVVRVDTAMREHPADLG